MWTTVKPPDNTTRCALCNAAMDLDSANFRYHRQKYGWELLEVGTIQTSYRFDVTQLVCAGVKPTAGRGRRRKGQEASVQQWFLVVPECVDCSATDEVSPTAIALQPAQATYHIKQDDLRQPTPRAWHLEPGCGRTQVKRNDDDACSPPPESGAIIEHGLD